MKPYNKSMLFIAIAFSAVLFSRCDNPVKPPDQVPHPETVAEKSDGTESRVSGLKDTAEVLPDHANAGAEDNNIH